MFLTALTEDTSASALFRLLAEAKQLSMASLWSGLAFARSVHEHQKCCLCTARYLVCPCKQGVRTGLHACFPDFQTLAALTMSRLAQTASSSFWLRCIPLPPLQDHATTHTHTHSLSLSLARSLKATRKAQTPKPKGNTDLETLKSVSNLRAEDFTVNFEPLNSVNLRPLIPM